MPHPQPIDWTATVAWTQAILLAGAIAAAVAAPYLAAHIERERRRRSATKLAELMVTALRVLRVQFDADPTVTETERETASSLHVPRLVERMEAFPTADIDDPAALEAFVRIAGAARLATVKAGLILGEDKLAYPTQLAQIKEMGELADLARKQLENLRERLGG